jgi:hypothetical protein
MAYTGVTWVAQKAPDLSTAVTVIDDKKAISLSTY